MDMGMFFSPKGKNIFFKAIFDEKHNHHYKRFLQKFSPNLEKIYPMIRISKICQKKHQTNMRKVRWVYVHGLASLLANSFEFDEYKKEEELADLIRIVDTLIYKGVIAILNPTE